MKTLTLVDLQKILGDCILKITNDKLTSEEHANELATAATVFAGARNMIHNASVIIRANEVIADGKVKDIKAIKTIVGE